jgi:dihydroorotate dehydrogenase (NAD+) catalytic subunit
VALRMVHVVSRNVSVPVIGMGGIMNAEDAVEFMMAGATAVAVGTANFANPLVTLEIIEGIEKFLTENGIADINEIIGVVE